MRRLAIAMLGVAMLAGCGPSASDIINAEAADAVNRMDMNLINPPEPPPPPYVAGPDDAKGENEVTNAMPGELHYRDLPAARLFRGDWTVEKTEWFAVRGSDTPPRSPARMRALAGAHIRIDRQNIALNATGDIALLCPGVSYIDKDRLIDSMHQPMRANNDVSREDVLRDYGIAVAEKEVVERVPGLPSADGQVLSIYCSEAQGEEADEDFAYISGAMLLDRDHMVLFYADGTALFMKRDAQ